MDVNRIRAALERTPGRHFDLYERRPGEFQVILPILHEDGDMLEIYLQEIPGRERFIRVCDFGHALMRLSYTFEVNSPTREKILDSILYNNDVLTMRATSLLKHPSTICMRASYNLPDACKKSAICAIGAEKASAASSMKILMNTWRPD